MSDLLSYQTTFDPNDYYSKNLSIFPAWMDGPNVVPPKGWTSFYANLPSEAQRKQWNWDGPNVACLACGKVYDGENRLVVLDVDDDRLVACLSYLFPSPVQRFGSKGMALFYRANRKTKSLTESTSFYAYGKGKAPLVEYMSVGKMLFIPPFKHRKTGKPYKWVNNVSLVSMLDQLPEITAKDLRVIKTIVELNSEGGSIHNILEGEGSHNPTVSLTASLVALGLPQDKIERAVTLLFPKDYKGDTLNELPAMVASAVRKGFDKKSGPSSDPEEADLSDLFADWHYIKSINKFVNSATKEQLDRERFDASFGKEIRRAHAIYLAWPSNSIKPRITYLPSRPPVMDDAVNMWRQTELPAKAGDVTPWLAHILRFYTEEEVTHLVNWLSYILQHSHTKAGHAILMGSKYEGIGKDLWLTPIRAAFGKHNVSEIGADSLSSQFNEWLAHKHLIIIQEIWTGSKRELSNQLKPLLSSPPDEIMVNEKGVARYPIPNICASIMLTNHKDAVSMAAEDRRYFVMWTDARPEQSEYYSAFADWVNDPENQSHVLYYLMHRDVSKFNIKAPPPKTKAKMEMVDATMTRGENTIAVIRDLLKEAPLKDIVSENGIYAMLHDMAPDIAREVVKIPKFSPRYPIRKALVELGYTKLDIMAVKRIGNKVHQLTVYATPEAKDKYEAMRPVELYDLVNVALDF